MLVSGLVIVFLCGSLAYPSNERFKGQFSGIKGMSGSGVRSPFRSPGQLVNTRVQYVQRVVPAMPQYTQVVYVPARTYQYLPVQQPMVQVQAQTFEEFPRKSAPQFVKHTQASVEALKSLPETSFPAPTLDRETEFLQPAPLPLQPIRTDDGFGEQVQFQDTKSIRGPTVKGPQVIQREEPIVQQQVLQREEPVVQQVQIREDPIKTVQREEPIVQQVQIREDPIKTVQREEPIVQQVQIREDPIKTVQREEPIVQQVQIREDPIKTVQREEPIVQQVQIREDPIKTVQREEPIVEQVQIREDPVKTVVQREEPIIQVLQREEPVAQQFLQREEPLVQIREDPTTSFVEHHQREEPSVYPLAPVHAIREPVRDVTKGF